MEFYMKFYEINIKSEFEVLFRKKSFGKYVNACVVTGICSTEYIKAQNVETAKSIAIQKTKQCFEKFITENSLKTVVYDIHQISYDYELRNSKALHDKSEISKVVIKNVIANGFKELSAEATLKHFTVEHISEEFMKLFNVYMKMDIDKY